MNQQNHDFQEDEVTTGNFELLEDVEADARVNRNVPAGTLFLTLSGKLPVERLRPGMTVLDSVGHHRSVAWCKRITGDDPSAKSGGIYRRARDLVVARTRFPRDVEDAQNPFGAVSGAEYWVVLSAGTVPVKRTPQRFDPENATFPAEAWALMGNYEDEPEITNIFADTDGPTLAFARA